MKTNHAKRVVERLPETLRRKPIGQLRGRELRLVHAFSRTDSKVFEIVEAMYADIYQVEKAALAEKARLGLCASLVNVYCQEKPDKGRKACCTCRALAKERRESAGYKRPLSPYQQWRQGKR